MTASEARSTAVPAYRTAAIGTNAMLPNNTLFKARV